MKIEAAKKMSLFSPSIFGRLKKAADERNDLGKNIIDLSLGSPDIPPNPLVRETLASESAKADSYGYTLGGLKRFNEAVSNYYKRRTGVILDPETEILQTMGSQEGLVHLPFAFCNEHDVVITTNPAYIAYDAGIKLAGATPYYLPLRKENNFLPDLDAIPASILQKAKLLILNLPGNPVPATPTKSFFEKVVAFAKKHHVMVLHDAAYSEFYFTGNAPVSFLETHGAKEVGLEINSLSKSFSLAGARVAYMAGNPSAIRIMRELKSNLDYGIFAPIQEAAIVALNHAEEITEPLRHQFKARHHLLSNGLIKLGWEVAPSSGGMFIWARYPYPMNDVDFALETIKQVGVVMVPGSTFGSEGEFYVRLALVQDINKLKHALQLLKKLSFEI